MASLRRHLVSFILIILIWCVFTTESQFPCDDPTPPDIENKAIPRLPSEVFQADMALTIFDESSKVAADVFVSEFYDYRQKRFAVMMTKNQTNIHIILDFKTNQSIVISDGNCQVQPMNQDLGTQAELHQLFPELSVNFSNPHIFSPLSLLGVNREAMIDANYTYLGNTSVREITADYWKICIKANESILVYWSVPEWSVPSAAKLVPVGYQIITRTGDNEIKSHTYTVVDFRPYYVNPLALEIPPGIQCPGIQNESPFPSIDIQNGIHFNTESVSLSSHQISFTENSLDYANKLGRLVMEIPYDKNKNLIKAKIITDFTANLTFVTDGTSCRIEEYKPNLFQENEVINLRFMQLVSNPNFFDINKTQTVYLGKRTIRNIPCLVWQTTRKDWPVANEEIITLWDWYFSDWTYEDKGIEGSTGFMVPIHLQIRFLKNQSSVLPAGTVLQFNIYDFYENKEHDIDSNNFDVANCFDSALSLNFEVDVQGSSDYLTKPEFANSRAYLYMWKLLIARESGIPLLRISDVKAIVINSKLYIQFLLGNASNATKGNYNTSMEEARNNLEKSIANGNIQITQQGIQLTAISGSLTDVDITCTNNPVQTTTTVSSDPSTASSKADSTTVSDKSEITSTTQPVSSTTTGSPAEAHKLKHSKLFSSGATAGITISSFLGGLLAGTTVTFFYKARLKST